MKKIVMILAFIILLGGCTTGENKPDLTKYAESDKSLMDKTTEGQPLERKPAEILGEPAVNLGKPIISEEAQRLKSLEKTYMDSDYYRKDKLIPLTVSKDFKYFIVYKIRNENMSDQNELILIGMPRQTIDLYRVDLTEKKSVKIGKTEFVISYAWSKDGRRLSLVSHKSVKILDIAAGRLTEVPLKYETDSIYNSNWGPDNRTLYIHLDTVANYYVYNSLSKKMFRTRGHFKEGDIACRGYAGKNILTSLGEQVGTAKGLYLGRESENLLYDGEVIIHDINGSRILVSYNGSDSGNGTGYMLEDYDTVTGERRKLNDEGNIQNGWNIYKASYLKTTGDVIYTTFETNGTGVRYLLVRIGPDGKKTVTQVPSPLYTVTPGENILHFAVFKNGESCLMDIESFKLIDDRHSQEFKNRDIRALMFRALNIYSSETPDIEEIEQVFINTYDRIPQEALENIILEMKNANSWKLPKLEPGKNITMALKQDKGGSSASVVLNELYFRGPHELVRKEGKWYITGFSTWPESKVRNDVYKACSRYIKNEIKKVKAGKAMDEILAQATKIEVGEIELWSMSEPHRAVSPNTKEARVKIIATLKDGSTEKYQAYFSRRDSGDAWKCEELGKLSAGLFPAQ